MTEPATARQATVDRYSGLARIAIAGGTPMDACKGGRADCSGADRYDQRLLDGVPDGALRAGLGCGNPHAVARIRAGDTVLDLGSGGGLDLIVSARRAGPTGHAYGLDASPDMLALAHANLIEAGIDNATLLHGHIEDVPLPDASVDVVISNCVINLSHDKHRVLAEAHRVLRPGGRLGITDVVAAPAGAGAHALTVTGYRDVLAAAGFGDIHIEVTHDVAPGLRSAIIQATR